MNDPGANSLHFIFLYGKGGAGKDIQAQELLNTSPFATIINTGDIFRNAHDPENRYHDQISPYIQAVEAEGQLIPDDVMIDIVRQEILESKAEGNKIFIFTGFPRTEPQLTAVDRMLANLRADHEVNEDHILLIVLDKLSQERARTRREEAAERGMEPRTDDLPETVVKRLRTYHDLIDPMLHRLDREHRLKIVRGDRSIKVVEEGVRMKLEGQVLSVVERE